jgi:protein involved in polysaccharide export with SLBB domain
VSTILLGCGPRITVPVIDPSDIARLDAAGNYPDSKENYRIEPGDVLRIRYTYQPDMNQDSVQVGPDGKIDALVAGKILAAGRTTTELQKILRDGTAERLKDPEIVVSVDRYSDKRVYVSGEVRRPGPIVYRLGLTPLQAIIDAGGFMDTAEPQTVILIRTGNGADFVSRTIDLETAVHQGVQEQVLIAPHDVIFVPKSKIANANLWVKQHLEDMVPWIRGVSAGAAIP